MGIEIYWGSGSHYAWRVLLAAEVKGVAYESRLLSFQAKEHQTPSFLAMNPRGKVPVLRDGERVVTESMAIMHHLDGLGSGPSLFGRTHDERTAVWEWTSRILSDLEDAVDAFARPVLGTLAAAEAAKLMQAALPKLHRELKGLEVGLAERQWLCGWDTPSAADLAAFPFIMFVHRAATKEAARQIDLDLSPFPARYPNLAAWQARIEALPGYERTYPPHWRPGG